MPADDRGWSATPHRAHARWRASFRKPTERPNPGRAECSRHFDLLRRAKCRHHNPRDCECAETSLWQDSAARWESKSALQGTAFWWGSESNGSETDREASQRADVGSLATKATARDPRRLPAGELADEERRPVQGNSPSDRKDYPDFESPQESLRRSPPCLLRESACIKLSKRAIIFQRTEV